MYSETAGKELLPPYLDAEACYATRNGALTPAVVWKLRGDRLQREDGKGPPRETKLSEVQSVQLEYCPARPDRNRYRCRITLNNAIRLEMYNRTYRGVYDFMDTSAEYRSFMEALHEKLEIYAPQCRFVAGTTATGYAVNVAILVFVVAAVLGALAFFLMAGMIWVALIKVVLILFYLPTGIKWARRNKLRTYRPGSIPDDVLPSG